MSEEKMSFDNEKEVKEDVAEAVEAKVTAAEEKKEALPDKAESKKEGKPQAKKTAAPKSKKRTVVSREEAGPIKPPEKLKGVREKSSTPDHTVVNGTSSAIAPGNPFGGNGIKTNTWN